MINVADHVREGDDIIFRCDEYRSGQIQHFDGTVLNKSGKGVDVIYLSGHKSRNDFIEWKDIIAKVDKSKPYIELPGIGFCGRYVVFDQSIFPITRKVYRYVLEIEVTDEHKDGQFLIDSESVEQYIERCCDTIQCADIQFTDVVER